jgi:uncharacterized protein (DUF302 family)
MTEPEAELPAGTVAVDGVVHRPSPLSVGETVDRLVEEIGGAGAKLFAIFDQSGEARRAGLDLRETRLVIFGNPAVGTRIMEAAPEAALDLPLKVLVWQDDDSAVWMSFLAAEWLAARYSVPPAEAKGLAAPDTLTARVAGL